MTNTNIKLKKTSYVFFTLGLWSLIAVLTPQALEQQASAKQETATAPRMSLAERNETDAVNTAIQESKDKPEAYRSEKVEISCYTPAESHGANGRIDGVSVATYRYPIGTWIEIEGLGKRRVDTRTAKRYGYRIDVWMSPEECKEWGLQYRTVKILE